MKIVQVNYADLMGHRFNGHDLQLSLNKLGHQACQFVLQKDGTESTTIQLCRHTGTFLQSALKNLEYQMGITNLLFPFGKALAEQPLFKSADIIHYHLIHNNLLSMLDFPHLTDLVPSVWTVHDPWTVTGHCVYPLNCMKWKSGCMNCPNLKDPFFPMQIDNASQMWNIKKQAYQKMNVDIVVTTQFMKDYISNSPLTAHFKHVHKILFGVNVHDFEGVSQKAAKDTLNIPQDHFVIAFRADPSEIKGHTYLIKMLDSFKPDSPTTVLTVGNAKMPDYITEKYNTVELGWQNDTDTMRNFYAACNVFIMPSLAESFGMMAMEAMAAGRPVIVFENTVLPEITFAPECGIAVPYKSSDGIRAAVERLIQNPDECRRRGEKGKSLVEKHYRYEDYVNRHISLYHEILNRNIRN